MSPRSGFSIGPQPISSNARPFSAGNCTPSITTPERPLCASAETPEYTAALDHLHSLENHPRSRWYSSGLCGCDLDVVAEFAKSSQQDPGPLLSGPGIAVGALLDITDPLMQDPRIGPNQYRGRSPDSSSPRHGLRRNKTRASPVEGQVALERLLRMRTGPFSQVRHPNPTPKDKARLEDSRSGNPETIFLHFGMNKAAKLLKIRRGVPYTDKTIPISDTFG
jgi:hypothetical protein